MNLSNKQQVRFFANALFQRDDLKPNVIFDVTLKDLNSLYFNPVGRNLPENQIFNLEHFLVAKSFN